MEQPMKSALIGPWDGSAAGAPAKDAAAASKPAAAWRGPEGPPNRDPKWPEKDRPDYNAARDRPAPGRWRAGDEDPRDRNNWETDRWGSVEEPRRWQEDRGPGAPDRWGGEAAGPAGRGRGRPPGGGDDRWGERKPSAPLGEREWLPGMPPEPELPKRVDRWGNDTGAPASADRRPPGADPADRWRGAPGGSALASVPAPVEVGFTSTQPGRGRGFATGRGRGLKPGGPAAPGSGVPDRWDAPRGPEPNGGGSQADPRRYSSPQMSKIYNHMLSAHGEKLPTPRINPEVSLQYPEYLAGMAAETAAAIAAQQMAGGGSNGGSEGPSSGGPPSHATGGAPGFPQLITHDLFLQDKWVYKDPQQQTQGPFSRTDILEWLSYAYFGEDLPVRAAALEGAPFIALGHMMKMWDAIERGRPLGPPGFAGGAPAPAASTQQPEPAQQQQQPPADHAAFGSHPTSTDPNQLQQQFQQQHQQQQQEPLHDAPAAPGAGGPGGAQRTSSLLETLLGRKLASEPPVPEGPGDGMPGQGGPMGPGGPGHDGSQQPGSARPFTLDPPVQLHTAGSGGLGGLGGLGGPLGSGPLGGGLGGFGPGGMGPGGMGGMGPGGMGPGAWGGPLGGPGGPMPGGPGGPMLGPGWARDPIAGGFDPLRRPDMHPGLHAAAGIWGNAPFRPEGPPLGPGFVPSPGPGQEMPPQHHQQHQQEHQQHQQFQQQMQPPSPGPSPQQMQQHQQMLPPQQMQQQPPQQQAQQQQQPPHASAWGPGPVQQPVGRSLADIQREQTMEAARREQAMAAAGPPPAHEQQQQQQLGAQQNAWGSAGLPPALQQIFAGAAANKQPAQPEPAAPAPAPAAPAEPAVEPAAVAAQSSSSKKKKTPQLVLQDQPKPPVAVQPAAGVSDDGSGAGGAARPEPKLAPWAATAKPPTAGMTLREIQLQEAEAAARAARAAAQEAAAASAAVAAPVAAAPAGASPWARIAATAPGPNAAVVAAPPAAASAWKPAAAPPAAPSPAPAAAPAATADTSPNHKTAPASTAATAPAARGGRPAGSPAPAEPPVAPVGFTGTAPRGTTLAELLDKQLNPAPPAPAGGAAPKAWGGAAAKPAPVTNLRAVLYEESASDLEGGGMDEDLTDVLALFHQKHPQQQQQVPSTPPPAPAQSQQSANGGWSAASTPGPGPTLRDIQQQEEDSRRRAAAAAAAAAPPPRVPSGSAIAAQPGDDEGLFWDYGPAAGASAARAASVEAPKPAAPAARPAAPAPAPAQQTPRGGWASAVGTATSAAPPPSMASMAAKVAVAAPPARAPAAAVAAKPVAAPPARAATSLMAAPAASTSYAPAAAAGGPDDPALFDGDVQMSVDFRNWCRSKMHEFFGNDDLSLVHFLLTVNSRSEVADYCQMYMRGKPNVSTFVAEFLKRKDADLAAKGKGGKGKPAAAGGKAAAAVTEWQKAGTVPPTAAAAVAAGPKKGAAAGGKQQPVKKVGGITATIPGFSLLSDRA